MKVHFDSLGIFMCWLKLHSKKDFDYVLPLYSAFTDFVKNGGNSFD